MGSIVRRAVAIAGCSAVGPHGTSVQGLLATRARGRVRDLRFDDALPAVDPRGLDPATRYLTVAAALALANAGVRLRGDAHDRSGLVVGVTVASPESDRALHATIARHGFRGLSASLFARQVVNAAPGTCARLLALRGAHSVVSAGAATGLLAVIYAAELLATRDDVDRIVAAGLDELPPGDLAEDASEGAACVVLTPGAGLRVAGWSIRGPGRLEDASRAACEMAGVDRTDVTLGPDAAQLVGRSPGFTSALAVVVAAQLVRTGQARNVLVAQRGGASADCAIVVTGGG